MLKNFQDALLENVVLRGVNKIEKVLPRKLQNMVVQEEGKFVRKDTWILDTTGTNLLDALGLDYIDYERTYSNDIREIYDVLGIEAARQTLYNEIVEVMESSDAYINYHHLSLLCDRMTMNKNMVPIFRSGLLNDDIGPIAKATFEVHTEVLLNAARHADFDQMRGVSANVMCGQEGFYGTSAFSVYLNTIEMEKLSEHQDYETDDEDIFDMLKQVDDGCTTDKLKIHHNVISSIHTVPDNDYEMDL